MVSKIAFEIYWPLAWVLKAAKIHDIKTDAPSFVVDTVVKQYCV